MIDIKDTANLLERNKKIFKTWMRTVPKSVVIVSARKQDTPDKAAGTVAATISSFTTVAFEPDVYVSFNLKQNSSTLKTIQETKHFCVTFPANDKFGKELADRFARGDLPPPTKEEEVARYFSPNKFESFFTARGLKYAPCLVTLKHAPNNNKSGFAFGTWYEYESSLPVGDHVIVTAKALPVIQGHGRPGWSKDSDPEEAFFTSRMTLGHVHGGYATTEEIKFESHRLDDKSRSASTNSDKKAFCTSRLDLISQVKAGDPLDADADQDRAHTAFRRLLPELQYKLERYYMARISRFESDEKSAPKLLADTLEELSSWEQDMVRQKRRIPRSHLAKEKEICLKRLVLLESKSYDFQMESELDATDDELIAAFEDLASDTRTKRLENLRHYWRTRLRLINMVQLDRIFDDTLKVSIDETEVDLLKWINNSTAKFVDVRRHWSLRMLMSSRDQYGQILGKIRRTLMRAWSGDHGRANAPFKREIMAHCKTLTKAMLTLDWMIARRQHLDGMTRDEPLRPAIPHDTEIIERSKISTWGELGLDQPVEEVSNQDFTPKNLELSSAEFQDLLSGVMDAVKAKRHENEDPKKQLASESQP